MKRYDNIQILRVLACLGVFTTHLAQRMGITGLAGKIANFGASGVYLFFLISAFLACGSAGIEAGGGRKGVLSYYIRRACRILPLYEAVILYNFLLHDRLLRHTPPDPAGLGWLRYLFMTNAFFPAPDQFWGNLSGTWTISLFVCFYLTAPFLMRLVGKGSAHGSVVRAALLYASAMLLQQIWIRQSFADYMMFFYYLHFFVLGILVRQLTEHYRPMVAALHLVCILCPIALFLYLWSGEILYFTGLSWLFALLLLLTLTFSWEKVGTSGNRVMAGAIRICRRILEILDAHSFGIYLVHGVVIDGMTMLQGRMELSAFAVFVLVVGCTAAGAFVARRLIEIPAERLGRALTRRLT